MKLNPSNTAIIKRLLVGRSSRPLRSILNKLEPIDLASLFGVLNRRETRLLIEVLISIGKAVDTLREAPEQQLAEILPRFDRPMLLKLLVYAPEEDAAYFLSLLPSDRREAILLELEAPKRERIQLFLNYPEDSAGRMMQTQVFSIPADLTAAEGLDYLRSRAQEQSIYYIYCVTEDGQLVGITSLRRMATVPAHTKLADIIKGDVVTVSPTTDSEEVARLVAHYDFIAMPVVDDNNKLLGVITVDDVVDIIQEQATANIYAQAGLQEDERVYTPALKSIKNRIPWMALNLVLAAIASTVIHLFEATMGELIFLATVKNIVASMGGNTAIQSLTVVTRGIATGDFNFISYRKAVIKEVLVGISIGLFTGLGAGVLTYFWNGNALVSVVIFIAMFLTAFIASLAGSIVPLLLAKLDYDPAVGSGVIVTMITDIFGFFSFLGLATLGLRMIGQI